MYSNHPQIWEYQIYQITTFGLRYINNERTLRKMTPREFLSCLAWWNLSDTFVYIPIHNQLGIMCQHECRNIKDEDGRY